PMASCARCVARPRFITATPSSRGRFPKRARWTMSTYCKAFLLAGFLAAGSAGAGGIDYHVGIGREATPAEVAAWDIDVRPDFTGLPPGRGTVDEGEKLWERQCASCHGTFGE